MEEGISRCRIGDERGEEGIVLLVLKQGETPVEEGISLQLPVPKV